MAKKHMQTTTGANRTMSEPAAEELARTARDGENEPIGCAEVCSITAVHCEVLERVRGQMPDDDEVAAAANMFRLLGDPTRMKLLQALSHARMCVCDLSELMGMSHSAVSHQLRLLRTARVVRGQREGKMVFYTLDDAHIERLIGDALDHVRESGRGAHNA